MTRINVVPPSELHTKHLVAEYRELPRIFALVRAAQARGKTPSTLGAPARYTLGRGHVLFFYDKLAWLLARQKSLVAEMVARGYSPQFTQTDELLDAIAPEWINDWVPDEEALAINRQRIMDRSPWLQRIDAE
jgi:hypothetical protein